MDNKLKGMVSDQGILSIARYLVKCEIVFSEQNQIFDINSGILYLNNKYKFVDDSQQDGFIIDVANAYTFLKNKSTTAINEFGYLRFKLDSVSGHLSLINLEEELINELNNLCY